MSWYAFACAFVDMKWKDASAGYRRDIARALVAATPAMISSTRGAPAAVDIRKALLDWGFNTKRRVSCPDRSATVLKWAARNSKPMSTLGDVAAVRVLLDTATTRLDGKRNAASTVSRNRAILYNAFEYAMELKVLPKNPLKDLKWNAPKEAQEVDRRCVVNPGQAEALLEAVGVQRPSGPRLKALFGLMYYAALRPEEAILVSEDDFTLPAVEWNEDAQEWRTWDAETQSWHPYVEDDDWGELQIRTAGPDVGGAWTDTGAQREERGLKHRPKGATRTVPAPPPLTRLVRAHIANFGTNGPGKRLFWGVRGDDLPTITYRRAWDKARSEALSSHEYRSPLAKRTYDLRHGCVSTWLNAGVDPTQVAEWAGHSVAVLFKIYAKCLVGQYEAAKRRIGAALRPKRARNL
ncbi:tyrosine-type recombinase/integrase [Flindersiella endophytica]